MNVIRPPRREQRDIVAEAMKAPMRGPEETKIPDALNEASSQSSEESHSGLGELGKSYGLVFINNLRDIVATRDGENMETLISGRPCQDLFFHGWKLYYTQGSYVFSWPNVEEYNFRATINAVSSYNGDIYVALNSGMILKSPSTAVRVTSPSITGLAFLNGEMYHTEGFDGLRGLVKTDGRQRIYPTGRFAQVVHEVDGELYFGGETQTIYSHDGQGTLLETLSPFTPWALCGVRETEGKVLYIGGNGDGIGRFNIDTRRFESVLLSPNATKVNSIVAAPLDFIERLAQEVKQ